MDFKLNFEPQLLLHRCKDIARRNRKNALAFTSAFMVRGMGLEPTQYCYHWNLNPARLPIPPPPRGRFMTKKIPLIFTR